MEAVAERNNGTGTSTENGEPDFHLFSNERVKEVTLLWLDKYQIDGGKDYGHLFMAGSRFFEFATDYLEGELLVTGSLELEIGDYEKDKLRGLLYQMFETAKQMKEASEILQVKFERILRA